jgi:DNA-binding NarL/FixJ family response regulator
VNAAQAKIRLVLVDDHDVVRTGLRASFERTGHIAVVGDAIDGQTGRDLILALEPDVALVDLSMPNMTGMQLMEQVCRAGQRPYVVVLSFHDAPERVQLAKRAGARGYLCKSSTVAQIIEAVERVDQGQTCFPLARPTELRDLSAMERQVATLITKGFSRKECADLLGIKVSTINTHMESIFSKWEISKAIEIAPVVDALGWLEERQ